MRNLSFALVLLMAVAISSCTSKETKQRMNQIDSLELTLDTISEKFNSLDSAVIAERFNLLLTYTDYLDSIPEEKRNKDLISQHRQAERNLRRYMSNANRLQIEIQKSYNQLDSLAYDVENDLVPEGEFSYYMEDEKDAVNRLRGLTFYIVDVTEREMARFDSLDKAIKEHFDANSIRLGQ